MKTKEFIKKVEELGYSLNNRYYHYLEIRNKKNYLIAVVSKDVLYKISTDSGYWDDISDEDKNKLLGLLIEYAKTPIKDREEEKKYYLRHKYFKCTNGDSRYFQIYESNGTPWLNAMYTVMGYKKQFTLKEIEEIKERFDTDLSDFELIEVEE